MGQAVTEYQGWSELSCRGAVEDSIRKRFVWYDIYNVLELIFAGTEGDKSPLPGWAPDLERQMNHALFMELAAWRMIKGKIVPYSTSHEIHAIKEAIAVSDTEQIDGAVAHLHTAMELLGKRPDPDYRNSIKESISAVECVARTLGADHAGLEKPLKKLKEKYNLPETFKIAFEKLYGYTSDRGGIRHALLDDKIPVTIDEAKFMLVACSGFVTYLIAKAK